MEKQLLAKWESRGKRWFVELYAETLGDLLPGYSYRGVGCGGYIGTVAPEVALQHAAREAGYCPSKMSRVFYDEALAARCCEAWAREETARDETSAVREGRNGQ